MELVKNYDDVYQSLGKIYNFSAKGDLEENKKFAEDHFAREIGRILLDSGFIKKDLRFIRPDGTIDYCLRLVVLKQE